MVRSWFLFFRCKSQGGFGKKGEHQQAWVMNDEPKKTIPNSLQIKIFQHLIPCFGVEVRLADCVSHDDHWSSNISLNVWENSLDKKGNQQNLLVWWLIFNSRATSFKTSIRTFLRTSLRPPFLPTCFHLSFDPRSLRNGFRRRFVAWNKKKYIGLGGQRWSAFDNYVGGGFQRCFIFTPNLGEMISIWLIHIFQMGGSTTN